MNKQGIVKSKEYKSEDGNRKKRRRKRRMLPMYIEILLKLYLRKQRTGNGRKEFVMGQCSATLHTSVTLKGTTPSYDGRRHHEMYQTSGQYAFSCCRGHLCNNETVWPELPPVPIVSAPDPLPVPVSPENASNSPSKLILAITCPILVFFLLLAFILFIMHRAHKKRMKGHHRVPVDFHEGSADLDELGLRATAARGFHS
ncbi:unnamed protein product [Lepeophtheirus salmonis]|uniref:(salmon louse) hypothetical protein n=1 Tax=Lepeophtheirus salmonis TaxID=72036 RepID=A0A7R8D2E3_LEPSM|nr:unnamed protein product [Lepeophtheirus salmonis]CAF3002311.1 unnamed protein product [Lepeophtheirus salmonis]